MYLTTYEVLISEEPFFSDAFPWATITLDEGHRIKNENARVCQSLNRIHCPFRLLLTGTPLQNDLHELWALCQYILPAIFVDSNRFDEGMQIQDDTMNHSTCMQVPRRPEQEKGPGKVPKRPRKRLPPLGKCYRGSF